MESLKDRFIRLFRPPAHLLSSGCGGCRPAVTSPAPVKVPANRNKEGRAAEKSSHLYAAAVLSPYQQRRNIRSPSPPSSSPSESTMLKSEEGQRRRKKKKKKKKPFLDEFEFSSESAYFYKRGRRRVRKKAGKGRRRGEAEEAAGFAVTKKSSDPYGDFQNSMAEMIVERQIFGTGELQWLLHSYLSLNSAPNHPVILKAFSDVSQVLFSC